MSAAEATAEAAAIELFAIFNRSVFCFSSMVALNVLFNDWISELSDDILSWLLLLFNGLDCMALIWLFDGFDCSWKFVILFAELRLMPTWLFSIFGHFGWWQRILCGEKRLSGVRGKRPSLRCWYWYLNHVVKGRKLIANGKKLFCGNTVENLRVKILFWTWVNSYLKYLWNLTTLKTVNKPCNSWIFQQCMILWF